MRNRSVSPSDAHAYPTLEEIQPLAFESEAELQSVLSRLRSQLKLDIHERWKAQGGDMAEVEAVEQLVLEQFFDQLGPGISSNCTFGGVPWSEIESRSSESVVTQPFQEVLHERVLKYQDRLFESRVENVLNRKNAPITAAETVQQTLNEDQERLAMIAEANATAFPGGDEMDLDRSAGPSKPVSDSNAISTEQAEKLFLAGVETINETKTNVARGIDEAVRAVTVAGDSRGV